MLVSSRQIRTIPNSLLLIDHPGDMPAQVVALFHRGFVEGHCMGVRISLSALCKACRFAQVNFAFLL